jgi:LPS-assembly lipoprotein
MRTRAPIFTVTGRFLCVAVVSLLLVACGFHLRGSEKLPAEMSVTYIQGAFEFDAIYDAFRTALESHGARVTLDRGGATAVLNILKSDSSTDVQTVNLSGQALEYRLSQNIHFEVTAADGRLLVERQSVTQTRVVKFNVKGLLGSEREAETIRAELTRDVVNLAMLRITAVARR